MNIEQLIYFIEIAETSHLTHAAENLNLSQPALSSSIARLENELNIKLFERKNRSIKLNAYGQALLPYAKTIVSTADSARFTLSKMQHDHMKTVKIQTSYLSFYPELLSKLLELEPDLSIVNSLEATHILEDNLITEKTDFCLVSRHIHNNQLCCEVIEEQELFIAVSKKNPLSDYKELSPDILVTEGFIVYDQYSIAHSGLKTIFEGTKLQPNICCYAINYNDTYEYVMQNIGIAVTTPFIYYSLSERHQHGIKLIPVKRNDGSSFFYQQLLYWRKQGLTDKQKQIRNTILEFYK